MRLHKYLSSAGVCSRRQGEKYIKDGRIRVNGHVIATVGTKIDPDTDRVEFDEKLIEMTANPVYIALNKPRGYVTSCSHPGEKIILDLVDIPERIYPVGRLDKDSTGLLLLTNDGRLHHRLSHPSFDHEKEYHVTVSKPISDNALQRIANGMPLMGTKTREAEIQRISSRRFRIILKEGKNRQIRRMVKKVGNKVMRLKRIRVASVRLGKLAEGNWRFLTENEQKVLGSQF